MKNLIIAFILGALSSLSMAPLNLWETLFIGLSGLYILVHKAPSRLKAAITGGLFSLGYFGFSLSWIGNALLVEGNPYWWAWPFAVSGLPITFSLFTAIGLYIYKSLFKNSNNFLSYISFAILLTLSEYARGHLFTGFPWNLYGYTWIDVLPIAQIVSLWDIYLLTFLTIVWASAPAFVITSNHTVRAKTSIAFLIMLTLLSSYAWGAHRIQNTKIHNLPDYEVIIVQPNIKQSEKWKPENKISNFTKLIGLSKYSPAKNNSDKVAYYIIWPETAISQDLLNSKWAIDMISQMLLEYPNNAYLITGALRYNEKLYFNSIITFNNTGEIIHTYDKSHLVPFGEYMPFENIFDIAPIVGFTGFKKGSGRVSLELPEGIKFSPLICYEVIFPNSVINKTNKPDFIINVTNDAWYEGSFEPHQHLVQTKFRAIETGLPIFRSANTGISAVINPLGHSENNNNESTEVLIIKSIPILNERIN